MATIVVQEFMSLDGVAQAPGGSDEDREGGFPYGGWATDYDEQHADQDGGEGLIAEWESKAEALLLGRETYQIWETAWGVWPEDAPGLMGEFTRRYNRIPKYVASSTLTPADLSWKNSHLLGDDVPDAVRRLRDDREGEIRIWGSTVLIRSLAEHDLIDEYRLMVYPVVLGTGKRLFEDGFPLSRFELAESRALARGVVVNTYRRVG